MPEIPRDSEDEIPEQSSAAPEELIRKIRDRLGSAADSRACDDTPAVRVPGWVRCLPAGHKFSIRDALGMFERTRGESVALLLESMVREGKLKHLYRVQAGERLLDGEYDSPLYVPDAIHDGDRELTMNDVVIVPWYEVLP